MEIITPFIKHKVELKDFITGREANEIQKPVLDLKMNINASKGSEGEFSIGDISEKMTDNMIKIIVVSIDGDKKDIVNRLKDMRNEDYKFVLREVEKVYNGENFTNPELKQEDGTGSGN